MSLARRRTFPLSWPCFIYLLTYPPVQAPLFPLVSRVRVSAGCYTGKSVKSLYLRFAIDVSREFLTINNKNP